ncbi:hypothetical protein [Lysinibacillus sp. UGB7]|uniref:hypothetical protein n=1 Tax=Lysinibacillus TaxID=400634 RepID=UPI003B76DC0C
MKRILCKKEKWREWMRGLKMYCFILLFLIFITDIAIKNKPSPIAQTPQTDFRQNYAQEIGERLQSSNFTKEVLVALRAEGYFPDSTVGYLIDSPDNQFISIYLHNSDELEKSSKEEIQKIVNAVAKNNNINSFIVDIQESN